jgi:hypothetical protein
MRFLGVGESIYVFCGVPADKGCLDRGEQRGLVAFDHQQVVALLFGNLLGDAPLAAHGVDTHQQALEVECQSQCQVSLFACHQEWQA